MNQVSAIVKEIETTDVVTYIRIQSANTQLTLIKTKTPEWLSIGDKVYCMFQEASVCVGIECSGNLYRKPSSGDSFRG